MYEDEAIHSLPSYILHIAMNRKNSFHIQIQRQDRPAGERRLYKVITSDQLCLRAVYCLSRMFISTLQ